MVVEGIVDVVGRSWFQGRLQSEHQMHGRTVDGWGLFDWFAGVVSWVVICRGGCTAGVDWIMAVGSHTGLWGACVGQGTAAQRRAVQSIEQQYKAKSGRGTVASEFGPRWNYRKAYKVGRDAMPSGAAATSVTQHWHPQ